MNKGLVGRLLPHVIAVIIFLVVALLYCKPAMEGKVVAQHDITQWKGAIHQSEIYKETHGQYPLWTNSMFSGMPAFQIGLPGNNIVPWVVHNILTLGLPIPIQFFFLACICFYFLCIVLRVNPYVGIFGALAFAYATYDPVIISVGHNTKMWSIAYMPGLIGSILLVFERRRYWLGAALTGLLASVMVAMNHPQIDYYCFIAIGVMTLFYIVNWVRAKDTRHLVRALSFVVIAGLIGLFVNAVTFLSTYQYQKNTIRGGSSELDVSGQNSKTGLDKDYAFAYSLSIAEPMVLMFPKFFGGSSDHQEVKQEDSKAIEALQQLPKELQQQLPLSWYWGGIEGSNVVGTSGPPYVGAIICFLAIIGLFIVDPRYKWWIVTTIVLTIMMSWGMYFNAFNSILYHLLPLYNKFRAPSMIMVIPQMLLPLMAVLTVDKIGKLETKQDFIPYLKKGLIGVAAIFVIALLCYVSMDFLNSMDKQVLKSVNQANQPQLTEAVRSFFEGVKADRRSLMMGDILRALGFSVAGLIVLYLMMRKTISSVIGGLILAAIVLIDLLPVDSLYLNSDSFVDNDENTAIFQKTAADNAIQADAAYPNFRVFNVSGDAFNENITSYYYNSVGGYHPAKLRIYQDLIEKQLSKQQINMSVFNMLNTKYFIQKEQGKTANYQKNDSAIGNVWFVKSAHFVKNAAEEMQALDHFNPKDTAIMQENFRSKLGAANSWDANGTIQLVKNDNDVVKYKSSSGGNQLAVFSEIYYDAGWKAFVDNKEVPILKVNYVLRALPLAAGNHDIVFKFEPSDFYLGKHLTTIFSILLLLLIVAGIYFEWRRTKTPQPTV